MPEDTKEIPNITTIKLQRATKHRLDILKEYKRETYEEILQKIFNLLNLCKVNPERARARLLLLDKKRKIREKTRNVNQNKNKGLA